MDVFAECNGLFSVVLQVRRPLPPSLSQQRSLQPLSFQNPVYQLTNPAHPGPAHSVSTRSAHSLRQDSSSENLSTESSHNSHSNSDDYGSQVGETSLNESI